MIAWWPSFVSATGPLCRCGCQTIKQDGSWRWRCLRGHFARKAV